MIRLPGKVNIRQSFHDPSESLGGAFSPDIGLELETDGDYTLEQIVKARNSPTKRVMEKHVLKAESEAEEKEKERAKKNQNAPTENDDEEGLEMKDNKIEGTDMTISESISKTFVKAAVSQVTRAASTLTRTLVEKNVIQNSLHTSTFSPAAGKRAQPKEPVLRLRVYIDCIPVEDRQDVIWLDVMGSIIVEDVIGNILTQYADEGRKPCISSDTTLYDLRMVDDDEQSIEDDLPPLVRSRDILKFDVDAVSLYRAKGVKVDQILKTGTRESTTVSHFPSLGGKKADKMFLRILMQSESHVVEVCKFDTLEEAFKAYAKKRKDIVMKVEDYEFFKSTQCTSPIDMDTVVEDLRVDTLELRKKPDKSNLPKVYAQNPQPSDFFFSEESASVYKEYDVVKHNRLGRKQARVMGIDSEKIHNLPPKQNLKQSLANFDIGSGTVKRQSREVSDVVKCEMIQRSKMFVVHFRDLQSNAILPIKYEAVNEYECAEIVAKIEFLRKRY